jgi:hypothetical protein
VKQEQLFVATCVVLVKGNPNENTGLILNYAFRRVEPFLCRTTSDSEIVISSDHNHFLHLHSCNPAQYFLAAQYNDHGITTKLLNPRLAS